MAVPKPPTFANPIPSQYAYATVVMGPMRPPEPPRPDKVWMTKPELMKRERLTEDAFTAWLECPAPKFPVAAKRSRRGTHLFDLIWSDSDVDGWKENVRVQIGRLQALLKQ